MNEDYIAKALRTEPEQYTPIIDRIDANSMRLIHAQMGLTTEIGELTDTLKRHIFYGKELDNTNLVEEVGDLCWYLAIIFDYLQTETGITPIEILQKNIDKLAARYPDKFSEDKALNRDLDKEKQILDELTILHHEKINLLDPNYGMLLRSSLLYSNDMVIQLYEDQIGCYYYQIRKINEQGHKNLVRINPDELKQTIEEAKDPKWWEDKI